VIPSAIPPAIPSDSGVGRVLGTQHTTTSAFRVVLNEDDYLQLDDLVVVRTEVPKQGQVRTYGVVTESEAIYEGAQYESDTHRIAAEGTMPGAKVRSAQIAVTRVDPEVWVSPDPGEIVERAAGEERRKALYVDEMARPLPIGMGRDGEPVYDAEEVLEKERLNFCDWFVPGENRFDGKAVAEESKARNSLAALFGGAAEPETEKNSQLQDAEDLFK
jgi:hypothetical protein